MYLEAGLSPAPGDADRGAYLRWLAFYGAAFKQAIIDRGLKRDAAPRSISPYSDCETVLQAMDAQLAKSDYLLSDRCSAADVLRSGALGWMVDFGPVDPPATTRASIARIWPTCRHSAAPRRSAPRPEHSDAAGASG